MKKVAIFGAGGFGKEVANLIGRINYNSPTWDLIGFFDDNALLHGKLISHYGPCLGGINELNDWKDSICVVLAIASSSILRNIVGKITNPLVSFPNLIDPSYFIVDPKTFTIGKGNIIQGLGCASCDVVLGDFNIFNDSVVVGHDTIIEDYNIVMPGVRISGNVKIGHDNFFGVGSIVLQGLTIKNGVHLSAGSVMVTKPKDNSLYIGNPARLFSY